MSAIRFTASPAQLQTGVINTAAAGNIAIVAGATGQVIRVYRIFFVVGGTTTITFQDGNVTALSGGMPFTAQGSLVLDFEGEPWFVTSAGNSFVINNSQAIQVSGTVYFTQGRF